MSYPTIVSEMPIGFHAQGDMGRLKKFDECKIKVYCFAMRLSHSRFKYASSNYLITTAFVKLYWIFKFIM